MNEPDYKEMERLYKDEARKKSYCSHKDAKVSSDDEGVYTFHCLACGLYSIGNYQTAIRLGWLIP